MTDFYLPYVPGPSTPFEWGKIKGSYEWLHNLSRISQDPFFHGEGDVLTHTRMTLESMIDLEEWRSLEQENRGVLFWAGLLHDVGKPSCTRFEPNGRITTPNHTIKGEKVAREIMWRGVPDPVPFEPRERIAKLVRFHGLPLWFLEHKDPLKSIIRASHLINLKHLALLAEADARGRICEDFQSILEKIQLFREYAIEAGCYERAYPFATDLARMVYLRSENGYPDYVPYDDTWGEVVLMSGLPGVGKDTWIEQNLSDWPVISLDDIREELGIAPEDNQGEVIHKAKNRAKEMLRKKKPFVWNATNVSQQIRKPLIDLFFSYRAKVRIVYIEPGYNEVFKQNANRKAPVPEKVLKELIGKLDIPNINEANFVEYIV